MIVAVLDALAGPGGVVGLGDKVAGPDKIAGRASFAGTYYYVFHFLFEKSNHLWKLTYSTNDAIQVKVYKIYKFDIILLKTSHVVQ